MNKLSFVLLIFWCFVMFQECNSQESITRYYNGYVLRDHKFEYEDLWVENGKIISPQVDAQYLVDVKGALIVPGYIDLQINGAYGYDFTQHPEKVDYVAKLLPQFGVTSFLPTLISSSEETYRHALPIIGSKMDVLEGAEILGIHLEGPFLAKEKSGAHCRDYLKEKIDLNIYGDLNNVKIITLAPELSNSIETIKEIREKNIVVSAGHTQASYEQMQAGIAAGITLITHLFNAMSSLNHREPGIVGFGLTEPIFFSMICDGIHIHPAILKLAWNANPSGLVLVSDAMEALGLPNGEYQLGSEKVIVIDGKAVLKGSEIIAGSVRGLDYAVRFLHQATGCSIEEAIEAATLKPAKILGFAPKKGTLDIGADADFLFLNKDLEVLATYIRGVLRFDHPKNKSNF